MSFFPVTKPLSVHFLPFYKQLLRLQGFNCVNSFGQLDILTTCHFINLPICHNNAISCHFMPLHAISCHLINLPFHQLAISSTCHFINLPFHQLAISSTCHFINLPFHQLVILSTSHFPILHLIQLAILSTCHQSVSRFIP